MIWQGGAVLTLLILSVLASRFVKSHPRDLIFAIAALLTPLLGLVPSSQISQAFANKIMLSVVGLWFLISAWREKRFFPSAKTFQEKFPLPLLVEIFSAYLFYFACKNSGLDLWLVSFLQKFSFWTFLILSFFCTQGLAFLMPRPIVFALLFSITAALLSGSFFFIGIATITLSLLLHFFFSLVFFRDLKNNQ